jgi:hypothetical protein
MRYVLLAVVAIALGLAAVSEGYARPVLRPLGYWQLRRQIAGMAAVWGIGGPVERRGGSAQAVKRMGPSMVPWLIEMLDDSDRQIRAGAVSALGFFPERAAESIPALVASISKASDRYEMQGAGQTIDRLLPRSVPPPTAVVKMLGDKDADRAMVAASLVLPREPQNEAARAVIVAALRRVAQPNPDLDYYLTLPGAYRALDTLSALPREQRAFARADVERIARMPAEQTSRYSELPQLCETARGVLE